MGCRHGYHGHGCWGPGCGGGYGYGAEYGPYWGVEYGPRVTGRYGAPSRSAAAARVEAHLASLRDEVRAVEADLAALRGADERGTSPDTEV